MKSEAISISVPGRWGCSHCDTDNDHVKNFRGTCKHILCENCIIGAVNRNILLTKKTSERKAAKSTAIEVTCPCTRCRGSIQVSQVWYEEKNASVISLSDDEDDDIGKNSSAAAVTQVETEINLESLDDQTAVRKGIERGGLKPLFEKGDAVYALWEDSWYPGKILSYKQFDSKSRYGDVREYVVRFDDGDVGKSNDYNVFHHEDYVLFGESNEGEWKWKGVKNVTDGRSSDAWANWVGWYVADIDGKKQKFSTLVGALRAYDASVIRKKGNEVDESDLNLPDNYQVQVATPKQRERDVNVATPSPMSLSLLPLSNAADDDDVGDDASRFSDMGIEIETRETKRIKVEKDVKIHLPPPLEGDQIEDQFWSARNEDIEFTEEAFKKKSIFHLNSDVRSKVKQNRAFGQYVEQGIATPWFHKISEAIVPMIAKLTQDKLRDAISDDWMWHYGCNQPAGATQVAMWLKRVKVGCFVVMRHEYERCPYTPEWLKERDESSGTPEYIGPVYIVGVVTRKIKPHSEEETQVQSQLLPFGNDNDGSLPPYLCLVDWKRIGLKCDLKEETQKYINRICQPTVVNICSDFEKVYTDGATAANLRKDLWDNSSPFEAAST